MDNQNLVDLNPEPEWGWTTNKERVGFMFNHRRDAQDIKIRGFKSDWFFYKPENILAIQKSGWDGDSTEHGK